MLAKGPLSGQYRRELAGAVALDADDPSGGVNGRLTGGPHLHRPDLPEVQHRGRVAVDVEQVHRLAAGAVAAAPADQ